MNEQNAEAIYKKNYTVKPSKATQSTEKKEKAKRHPLDFYPTPAYATLALHDIINFEDEIFDGSCGDGEIIYASKMRRPDLKYFASDIGDYGFGKTHVDFLKLNPEKSYENIVMNPPFGIINSFLPHALKMARSKLAILAPISTMESEQRYEFLTKNPFTTLYVFSERITMYSRIDLIEQQYENRKLNPGVMHLGWFVWDKKSDDHSRVKIIAPGQKIIYKKETHEIRRFLNRLFKERLNGFAS